MAIGDLYTIKVQFGTPGGCFTSSFDYEQTLGSGNEDTLTEFVDEWLSVKETVLLNCMSDQVTLENITCQPEQGVNEVPGQRDYTGKAGAVVSGACPNNIAAVISQLTDAPNSNANGRVFLAGQPETGLLAGVWTAGQIVLLNAFAAIMPTNIVIVGPPSVTYKPVVISRVLAGVPRVPEVGFNILSAAAKGQARQQRRRTTQNLGVGT